jgi:hypothetical protein
MPKIEIGEVNVNTKSTEMQLPVWPYFYAGDGVGFFGGGSFLGFFQSSFVFGYGFVPTLDSKQYCSLFGFKVHLV